MVRMPRWHAAVARSSRAHRLAAATPDLRAHRLAAGTPIATRVDMPARSIDTVTLTFGLVAIPVKIYATSERSHEIHFHLVHEGCGERLHQQYVCPQHGAVDRDEIAARARRRTSLSGRRVAIAAGCSQRISGRAAGSATCRHRSGSRHPRSAEPAA